MDDPFNLTRFVAAQSPVMDHVRGELEAGRKRTHWMWFVFPQLRGLGRSAMATHYGLSGLAEARAYLAHPVLGPRLKECVSWLLPHADLGAEAVLGEVDAAKLRSCLTLFAAADPAEPLFRDALARLCGGQHDATTLDMLTRS